MLLVPSFAFAFEFPDAKQSQNKALSSEVHKVKLAIEEASRNGQIHVTVYVSSKFSSTIAKNLQNHGYAVEISDNLQYPNEVLNIWWG